MPTEKSSAEDAKAPSDPKGSTQNGSVANVAKSNGSKPRCGRDSQARLQNISGTPRRKCRSATGKRPRPHSPRMHD